MSDEAAGRDRLFAKEHRFYLEDVADEVETQRLGRQIEEGARLVARHEAALRWARRIGLPATDAKLVEVMLYSNDLNLRKRAAVCVCEILKRRARRAA